jgi:hypothetical protein
MYSSAEIAWMREEALFSFESGAEIAWMMADWMPSNESTILSGRK